MSNYVYLDNPYLDSLKALHKNTNLSLKGRIEQLNNVKLESSPLDIKLEPGLLQSNSYKEVLLTWLICAFVSPLFGYDSCRWS